MNLHEKIDDNTILYYVESNIDHYDENDDRVVDIYELSFGFYDCHYMVFVRAKYIREDLASVEMEGESKLFDSFEEMCEGELWSLIKDRCRQFDDWLKELNAD